MNCRRFFIISCRINSAWLLISIVLIILHTYTSPLATCQKYRRILSTLTYWNIQNGDINRNESKLIEINFARSVCDFSDSYGQNMNYERNYLCITSLIKNIFRHIIFFKKDKTLSKVRRSMSSLESLLLKCDVGVNHYIIDLIQ